MTINVSSRAGAIPYWVLVAFLALVFLTGGGARDDIQSLVLLRPVSVACLAYGLWRLERAQIAEFRLLFGIAAACVLLVLLQLVPLPPSIWTALPGRELAAEVAPVADIDQPWRPLSLLPFRTWNSFFSLSVPLAVLVLAAGCPRERRFELLSPLLVIGLASGLLGLLQSIGPVTGPLYFYRITNHGLAVGLFANRNHQAILLACLFPMLAVYAATAMVSVEQARLRTWLAMGAAAVLIPLILVTGSRLGLVLGLLALVCVPWVYRRVAIHRPPKRKARRFNPRYLVGVALVLSLGIMTVLLSRARAFDRLVGGDGSEELRWKIIGPMLDMIGRYLPFGSGMGSFVEIYQISEPRRLLYPNYLNHAHNDWLELALGGGILAIAILGAAVIGWARRTLTLLRREAAGGRDALFARLGCVIILLIAVASLVDYPLRVPSLEALFIVAAVWMSSAPSGARTRDRTVERGPALSG